ncbi:prosaposin [Amia ocellicauda]|uniref:prosaposin n=1 Tax=Amia ocellicauda TaxID=2972642 RepID=UPI0034642563
MSPQGWLLCLIAVSSAYAVSDPPITFDEEVLLDLLKLNSTEKIPGVCYVCRTVVTEVRRMLPVNDTKQQICRVLEHVCQTTHVLKFLCHRVVNNYIKQLVENILLHSSPRAICRAIRLCWW